MPDRYKELFTDSTVYLVIFSTLGGCLVRYVEEYRHAKKIDFKWLALDLLASSFLGFLTFWFCMENTDFSVSLCAIATSIVGSLGTRTVDIIRFLIFNKLGLPTQTGGSENGQRNQK